MSECANIVSRNQHYISMSTYYSTSWWRFLADSISRLETKDQTPNFSFKCAKLRQLEWNQCVQLKRNKSITFYFLPFARSKQFKVVKRSNGPVNELVCGDEPFECKNILYFRFDEIDSIMDPFILTWTEISVLGYITGVRLFLGYL